VTTEVEDSANEVNSDSGILGFGIGAFIALVIVAALVLLAIVTTIILLVVKRHKEPKVS
jgi:hypothetical protein